MNEEENKVYREGEIIGDEGLGDDELMFLLWEAYN